MKLWNVASVWEEIWRPIELKKNEIPAQMNIIVAYIDELCVQCLFFIHEMVCGRKRKREKKGRDGRFGGCQIYHWNSVAQQLGFLFKSRHYRPVEKGNQKQKTASITCLWWQEWERCLYCHVIHELDTNLAFLLFVHFLLRLLNDSDTPNLSLNLREPFNNNKQSSNVVFKENSRVGKSKTPNSCFYWCALSD